LPPLAARQRVELDTPTFPRGACTKQKSYGRQGGGWVGSAARSAVGKFLQDAPGLLEFVCVIADPVIRIFIGNHVNETAMIRGKISARTKVRPISVSWNTLHESNIQRTYQTTITVQKASALPETIRRSSKTNFSVPEHISHLATHRFQMPACCATYQNSNKSKSPQCSLQRKWNSSSDKKSASRH
jgi:hypothetical protein